MHAEARAHIARHSLPSLVAPGQGDAFTATILETNENSDEGNIIQEELGSKAFRESDSFRKLVLLIN